MQPHHQHDCSSCKFLGAVPGKRGPVDLYACADERGYTYIARESSEGPDYVACEDRVLDLVGEGFYPLHTIAQTIHRLSREEAYSHDHRTPSRTR